MTILAAWNERTWNGTGVDVEPFSISIALSVFMAYLAIDWLFTEYTLSIVELKKARAANVGALIYLLGAFGVVSYVADPWYVIPMAMGGWLGTYLSVWAKEHKHTREKT